MTDHYFDLCTLFIPMNVYISVTLFQSLSDDSVSPRRSLTPVGSCTKNKLLANQSKTSFEKPWWATSEDEDTSALAETAKKLWLKEKVEDIVSPYGLLDASLIP